MMKFLPVALVFSFLALPAYGAVYKCVDSRGNVTYTNDRKSAKNCGAIRSDLPVSSIPAYKGGGKGGGGGGTVFKNISRDTQRSRDANREALLRAELLEEEKALSVAKNELAKMQDRLADKGEEAISALQPYQGKVDQHQRNVDALHREILAGGGAVPGVRPPAPPTPPAAADVTPLAVESAPDAAGVEPLPPAQ